MFSACSWRQWRRRRPRRHWSVSLIQTGQYTMSKLSQAARVSAARHVGGVSRSVHCDYCCCCCLLMRPVVQYYQNEQLTSLYCWESCATHSRLFRAHMVFWNRLRPSARGESTRGIATHVSTAGSDRRAPEVTSLLAIHSRGERAISILVPYI